MKPDLKRLAEAVRKAEAELDAAKGRTATNESGEEADACTGSPEGS